MTSTTFRAPDPSSGVPEPLPEGVEFVAVQWVDVHGAAKAKLVPRGAWASTAGPDGGGAGFAAFANHGFARGPEHPEFVAMPDESTLTVLPHRPNIAVAFSTVMDGDLVATCDARSILSRICAQAADRGLAPVVGMEPEFFLLRHDEHGRLAPLDPLDTLDKPCYDLGALLRTSGVLSEIVAAMEELGWGVLGDRSRGWQRPVRDQLPPRPGAHDRRPVHAPADDDRRHRQRPRRHRELHAQAAHRPHRVGRPRAPLRRRSVRRERLPRSQRSARARPLEGRLLVPRGRARSRTGARGDHHANGQLLPATALDRRIVGRALGTRRDRLRRQQPHGHAARPRPGRFENRAIDSSCNPYLAIAAIVAAGLDGVDRELDPGAPIEGMATSLGAATMPRTLADAIDALERDVLLRDALGEEALCEFVAVKRMEWSAYMEAVTDWEQATYLRRV